MAPEEHPQLSEDVSDHDVAAYLRLTEARAAATAGASSGGFGSLESSSQGAPVGLSARLFVNVPPFASSHDCWVPSRNSSYQNKCNAVMFVT